MRPVQLMDSPPMNPNACSKCGSGPKNREFFVDLGIDSVLHHEDHTGQHHITDGVIYLCNECMQSLINDYYRHVFKHIDNKLAVINAQGINNDSTVEIQKNEIHHLSKVVEELRKENETIRNEYAQKRIAQEQEEAVAAEQLLNNLLGEEEKNGSDGNDSDADGSNSDAEGAAENSDGNDSANESLNSDSLFDLKQGFLVRTGDKSGTGSGDS